MPQLSDFEVLDDDITPPRAGQVLVGVDVLSIDAFIRTVLDERSYHGSVRLGETVRALGVGRVIASASDAFLPGDVVVGPLSAQTMATLPAAALTRVDTSRVSASTYLGALGITTGITAYFGVVAVGAVNPGDTVVVSGAAGAVGSVAGQMARIAGAGTVVGIAGSSEKVAFLVDELGFDAAIDYRHEDVAARLGELVPGGIDVFYDNVGGAILDAALLHITEGSRVVICGGISQYQDMDHVTGPSNYLKLAERHARMEGFAVTHFADRFDEARAAITEWLEQGRLTVHEHVEHGIERFPHALRTLLSGGHHGKMLLDLRLP
jgi:NADPH-dependent curcumin reductase CurA